MKNLDNTKTIFKLDTHGVHGSIEHLPQQIKQILKEIKKFNLPKNYNNFSNVVINGMGGSSLGTHILKSLFLENLKIPVHIESGYRVPNFVNQKTLYIIVSYSGSTEEPLSTYSEAKKRGAKILAIACDQTNILHKLAQKHKFPLYTFSTENNPAGQPRLGTGYLITATISILKKCGAINFDNKEIVKAIKLIERRNLKLSPSSKLVTNNAKKLATGLFEKIPVLVGAEFLEGNLHTLRNQINETSKSFASFLCLPDLNHYAMEGLVNPKNKNLIFVFFDSLLYHKQVQLRSKLTKQVVSKNKIDYLAINLKGTTKIEQCFEMLQLGMWITYYLGILYNVDPVTIPFVDWFKKQLK